MKLTIYLAQFENNNESKIKKYQNTAINKKIDSTVKTLNFVLTVAA